MREKEEGPKRRRHEGEGTRAKATRGRVRVHQGARRGEMDETGREENGGCVWSSTQRGARNTGRVCAEFVSRIRTAVHRGRVIGHSLFLRRDYARSIYRLYSIDYTNLCRRVLSFALFFGRARVDEREARRSTAAPFIPSVLARSFRVPLRFCYWKFLFV